MERPIVVPRRNLTSPLTSDLRDPSWVPKPKPRVMTLNNSHQLNDVINSPQLLSPVAKPRRSLKRKQEEDLASNPVTPSSYQLDGNFRNSWALQMQQIGTHALFKGQIESNDCVRRHNFSPNSSQNDEDFEDLGVEYGKMASEEVQTQYSGNNSHALANEYNSCTRNVYSALKYPHASHQNELRKDIYGRKKRRRFDDPSTTFSCNIL